jgi:hypothetical protein
MRNLLLAFAMVAIVQFSQKVDSYGSGNHVSIAQKFIFCIIYETSRIPAVLLCENSRQVEIFYQFFIARKLNMDLIILYVSLNIINKLLLSPLSLSPKSSSIPELRADFRFVTIVRLISLPKQKLWFFAPFFFVLSFRATENIFICTRTKDSFSGLWPWIYE